MADTRTRRAAAPVRTTEERLAAIERGIAQVHAGQAELFDMLAADAPKPWSPREQSPQPRSLARRMGLEPHKIRAWARAQGIALSRPPGIPDAVVKAYAAAHAHEVTGP